jgi:hypothetical protein
LPITLDLQEVKIMASSSKFKILACDGGGIRGLITAVILERLEQKLDKPLKNYFDLFAGTSTGSIIACAIAKGIPSSEIRQFYIDKGINIFPNMNLGFWWNTLLTRIQKFDLSLPLFPMLDVFSDGSADSIDYISTQLIDGGYDRYQPLVPVNKKISTFQADPKNLGNLVAVANEFLARKDVDDQLNRLVTAISP